MTHDFDIVMRPAQMRVEAARARRLALGLLTKVDRERLMAYAVSLEANARQIEQDDLVPALP